MTVRRRFAIEMLSPRLKKAIRWRPGYGDRAVVRFDYTDLPTRKLRGRFTCIYE